ncbi:hypothetical protein K466DRAFT_597110 [Polyporus arcularius HHB13444]|uniref:Uncharacterized protein n=1 Tax=Polyporus arcularius HHB13444 TaxID=1314778 RepID=A0A5C3PMV0_9APHY|nr:hypothetical protein K466DRAFT_597110 [Polyporus arcularius HHB13444]
MQLFRSTRSPSWKIYAQELGGMGYGHPMWHPDAVKKCGEVQLGDIGYLDRGRFHLLFNCTRPRDDESHTARYERLPDHFEPFRYDQESVQGPMSNITHPVLSSRSSRETKISGEVGAGPSEASAVGRITHDTSQDSKASLRLHVPAQRTFLDCRGAIEQYMAKHCGSWLEFFNSTAGLKLAQKDIVFVYGFTTTSVWQVSAWSRAERERGISLRLLSECLAGVTAMFGCWRKRSHSVSPTTNTGPEGRTFGEGGDYKPDQCVFLDFCKTKTRHVVAQKVQTGARRLMGCLCCQCCVSADALDEPSAEATARTSNRLFDPVDALLDFILENPDVHVAFATYEDLYPLCTNGRLPADILAAAKTRSLPIVVVDGVGRIHQEPRTPSTPPSGSSTSAPSEVPADKPPEEDRASDSAPSARSVIGPGGRRVPAWREPPGALRLA